MKPEKPEIKKTKEGWIVKWYFAHGSCMKTTLHPDDVRLIEKFGVPDEFEFGFFWHEYKKVAALTGDWVERQKIKNFLKE